MKEPSSTSSAADVAKSYIDPDLIPKTPLSAETTEQDTETQAKDARPSGLLADSLEQGKTLLNEHKGKLAIGVAATLGMMVFYKWREKKLAEEDPEEYARLQRLKAVVRADENKLDDTPASDQTQKKF